MASFASSLGLRLMGFCGVDDSISAEHLQMISIHYPWVEWGILFRPDKEGTADTLHLHGLINLVKSTRIPGV